MPCDAPPARSSPIEGIASQGMSGRLWRGVDDVRNTADQAMLVNGSDPSMLVTYANEVTDRSTSS
jgi:hypothetical protein